MGTNFYFGENENLHIGKRSAAGLYCWDCGVSLCNKSVHVNYMDFSDIIIYGQEAVHHSEGNWLPVCPICGANPEKEDFKNSTGDRELGFNKNTPCRKSGVRTCCSFRWAISPEGFLFNREKEIPIFDEYGKEYTYKDFKNVLKECPIMYYSSIGTEFS